MMKLPIAPLYEQVPCTDSMKGLRAFLYCRVAHNDGFYFDLQSTELRRFAEQAGFTIAGAAAEYGKYPIGTRCKTQHRINASVVLTLIADMLKAIADYSKNDRAEFIKTVQEAQAAQQATDITKKKRRRSAAQKRPSAPRTWQKALFYIAGSIPPQEGRKLPFFSR